MKFSLTALATAAALSVAALSPANAAQEEYTMVMGSVVRILMELNLPTDNVGNLSASQIGQIISIGESAEMGDAAKARVQKILAE